MKICLLYCRFLYVWQFYFFLVGENGVDEFCVVDLFVVGVYCFEQFVYFFFGYFFVQVCQDVFELVYVDKVCYVFVEYLEVVVVFVGFVRVMEVVWLVQNVLEGFKVDYIGVVCQLLCFVYFYVFLFIIIVNVFFEFLDFGKGWVLVVGVQEIV